MANELNIPGFKHYELDSTYQAKLAAGEVNAKDLSFVKETGKIYTQGGEYGGEDITVDSALSTTSTNPVQNKVITTKVNNIDTRVQDIESFFEEGAKLNLTIKSNQGSDSSISAVKATVSYDGKSVQIGSGVIGLPVFTDVTITFPEVSGYKVPAPIVFTTGAVPVVYEATYETEIVRVTVNSWNGASVVGQIITINGTQYTWNGSTIQHKVPFGVEYEISCNAKAGFTSPAIVTNIASQVKRDVVLTYDNLVGTWITIDQTISDPATMISGNVNGEDIQLIRNNSHRYLGKYTAEGTMTICQLDDTTSEKYKDGNASILSGSQGDVFMKLPKFYYMATPSAPDVWAIGFYYGNSAPSSSWKEWDGNDLIGIYQSYGSSGKLYSRSSMPTTSSLTQIAFKDMASARGTGFSLVKWKHHNIMAFLFYAMYGNMNSQAVVGTNKSSSNGRTGTNDTLGMTDTVAGGDPSVDGNTAANNFWGLEDWWGDYYEYIDNVIADKDGVTWKITEDDGSERVITGSKLGGFMQKALIGAELDLIPSSTTNATATTGYCDSVLTNQRYSDCIVMRSNASNYPAGGIAYLSANSLDSETNGSTTSRLCFRGTIIEEQSSTTFKSLTAIG